MAAQTSYVPPDAHLADLTANVGEILRRGDTGDKWAAEIAQLTREQIAREQRAAGRAVLRAAKLAVLDARLSELERRWCGYVMRWEPPEVM